MPWGRISASGSAARYTLTCGARTCSEPQHLAERVAVRLKLLRRSNPSKRAVADICQARTLLGGQHSHTERFLAALIGA